MRGKKRPTAERTHALGIAVLDGPSAASQQTGIPEPTIRQWMHSPEFTELRERTKEAVTAEWWAIVQKGFRRVEALLDTTEDVQKVATATAIITDKMLLLTGQATSRSESRAWTDDLNDNEKQRLRDWIDGLDPATAEGPGATPAAEEPAGATVR